MELQGTDAKEGDNVGYITFGKTFKENKQHLSSFLNVPLSVTFFFNNISVTSWRPVSFIVGGNRRKPLSCRKSLTNFIT